MYNWYYMFNTSALADVYDKVVNANVGNVNLLGKVFGMTETFGAWSGFTMSALLILEMLILKFIYNINFDSFMDGIKKGLNRIAPTVGLAIMSLTLIVVSLKGSDSFVYTIINSILSFSLPDRISMFLTTFIHSFFVNDYFALASSLANPLSDIVGTRNIDFTVFVMQVGHGLASLVTPFSVYLIAGLAYLHIPYTSWLKHIWKMLLVLTAILLVIVFIVKM